MLTCLNTPIARIRRGSGASAGRAIGFAVLFVCTLLAAPPAGAATFDVNTTDDGADAMPGDGVCATATGMCSLRAAVQEANAMSDLDMINLPGGTYTLSVTGAGEDQAATGDLDILADVMIARSGGTGNVIINGSGDRLFDVFAPAQVTISNVTIENGSAGAEAGGAIRNAGTLMLNGVTMTHNTAADGGGLANTPTGSAQLVNVTIASNHATAGGGAIDNPKMGMQLGNLQLLNVTVSGNSAPNGNGIENLGHLTLKNTIVANGMSNNCYGLIPTSLGHNLDSASTCFNALPSDLTSTGPMLGPLQDNGGFTFTEALLPGSPAIDAGDDMDCPPTDQRGQPRPADGNMDSTSVCDIGAYEVQGPVVPTGTPSPSATPTDTPTPTQTSPVPTPTLGGPGIVLGSATGFPGAQVTFDATLSTGGALVGTAQNDISFDNLNTPIGTGTHGEPDCFVNFALGKASSFNFLPNMCVPGTCDMVRAAIVALSPPISPIPDGSTLYTCTVNIAADAAPGQYPLMISRVVLGDPGGTPVPNPAGVNGRIIVVPVPTATATPTVTSSPTSTATATPTVTATPSATATFTPTRLPCAGDCDGSGMVNIDDLTKIAAIALGDASLTTCPNADVDRNQKIDIEEVVGAVDKALHGCPQ